MFRTLRPATAGAAIALALTLGLSACSADTEAASEASAPPLVSPTPTVSASPTDPAEAAKAKNIADAKRRYTEFVEISDKHAKNGTNANEEFIFGGYLGDSEMIGQQEEYWADYTEAELKQTGDVRIVSMKVTEYEGDPLEDTILGHRVRMEVCVNTSDIDVVRQDGSSALQDGVPQQRIMDVLMQGQRTVWSVLENAGTGEAC